MNFHDRKGPVSDFNPAEMYKITRCRNCPNAVVDMDEVERACDKFLKENEYSKKQRKRLGGAKPKHHDIFHVAIAGCPNSCSQPQIKDFGLQGQAVPEVGEGCTGCGLCVEACPDNGIVLEANEPKIDRTLCLNCGKCAESCPAGTITVFQRGYRIIRGGKLGRRPVLAREVSSLTDEKGVVNWLQQTVDLLYKKGLPGERLGALLERIEKESK